MYKQEDTASGFIIRGKKGDGEPAKFFKIFIYQLDENGTPKVSSEYETESGEKRPNYAIAGVFNVPEVTLMRMITGETSKCIIWKRKNY